MSPAGLARRLAELRLRAARARLRRRYRAHADPATLDWDWDAIPYDRVALVNHLLAGMTDPAYLEIGCDADVLFRAVPVRDKTGVDPARGGNIRTTSDAFFAANTRAFDLIFVDGLHEYAQVHRDVANALAALKPGGWLLIHDMLPRDWREEHVPRLHGAWTGDVWKVAVELAATPGLAFAIAAIDHGVGIVRRGAETPALADRSAELADARFPAFRAALPRLPVMDWDAALAWIAAEQVRT